MALYILICLFQFEQKYYMKENENKKDVKNLVLKIVNDMKL